MLEWYVVLVSVCVFTTLAIDPTTTILPTSTIPPIHRHRECLFNLLWRTDYPHLDDPSDMYPDFQSKWDFLDTDCTITDTTCFKKENAKIIDHQGVQLIATSTSAAALVTHIDWIATNQTNVWNNHAITRLHMNTTLPLNNVDTNVTISTTINAVNLTMILSIVHNAVYLSSPSHNISVQTTLPSCVNPMLDPQPHLIDWEWDSAWFRLMMDGQVVYDFPLTMSSVSVSNISWLITMGLESNGATPSTLSLAHIELLQQSANTTKKAIGLFDGTCRPQHSVETCHRIKPFQPRLGNDQGYLSLDQIDTYIHTIIPSLFPPHFTSIHTIGQSIQNRSILAVCIGACTLNTSQVLYTGMHHSREPISMMNLVYTIDILALDLRNQDLSVWALLMTRQLWFVLVVNPDGFAVNEAQQTWSNGIDGQRKNGRDTCPSDMKNTGVDLNRNYDICFDWDLEGSNTDPCAEDYRGSHPFSEPETMAIKQLVETQSFSIALNYHSFGRYVNIPFACKHKGIPSETDMNIYTQWAQEMTWFNHFSYGQPWKDSNLYSVNGETSDWMWFKHGIYSVSPEVGPSFDDSHGFWPSKEQVPSLALELYYSNFISARMAGPLYILTIDQVFREPPPFQWNTIGISFSIENRGIKTGGDIDIVIMTSSTLLELSEKTTPQDDREDTIRIQESQVGTIKEQQRIQQTLIVEDDGVLHLFVRDTFQACLYIRLRVDNRTTFSQFANLSFVQYETIELPRCGICAHLGLSSDEMTEDDRCQSMNKVVTGEHLIKIVNQWGPEINNTIEAIPPVVTLPTPVPTTTIPQPTTDAPLPVTTAPTKPLPTTAKQEPIPTTNPPVSVTTSPPPLPTTAPPTLMPIPTISPTPSANSSSDSNAVQYNSSTNTTLSTKLSSFATVPVMAGIALLMIVGLLIVRRRRSRPSRSTSRDFQFNRRKKYSKVINDDDDEEEDDIEATTRRSIRSRSLDDEEDEEYGRRRTPKSPNNRSYQVERV